MKPNRYPNMRHIANQVIHDGNEVTRWKAADDRGRTIAYVTNTRAVGREAEWKISRVKDEKSMPESPEKYSNAEDAKAVVDKEYKSL